MTSDITKLIGNTPLYKLISCCDKTCSIFAKLEGQNIGGSIKDRVAMALIKDLEKKNMIDENTTIFEPSSGNTGIGLAMIGAAKGYKVRIMLPENATPERIALLKFFGADIEFCNKEDWKGKTTIEKCKKQAAQNKNYVMPNQYENPACVAVHHDTTAKEILEQCPDLTHFVATVGTGGTIMGVAKRLKKHNPNIQVIGAEIGADSSIPGPRSIQEWVPPIIDFDFIDKRVMIEDEEAVHKLHRNLAKKEGLFCGISSAAALHVAQKIAQEEATKKKKIVCIFPDRGEKYLSSIT
ncbi:MAG: cysteine synthase family protein [Patescibacteria group bacterium]|nr:cysteine synthase family protein [Patescibacteria group bacterium]